MISQHGTFLQRKQQIRLEQKIILENLRIEYLARKDRINAMFNSKLLEHGKKLSQEITHGLR
jgi:hypothetical protein